MQSDSIIDFSSISNSEIDYTLDKSKTDTFSSRKRTRGPRVNKWSKKEEERILKYALKLSEKEYLHAQEKEVDSQNFLKFNEIEEAKTVVATEEDFQNPLAFFDKLWEINENSTGIIKIIPPERWVAKQKENFKNNCLSRIQDPLKKLSTRKQPLHELYMAKKFQYLKDHNFDEYKSNANSIFDSIYNKVDDKITVEQIEEDYWRKCKEGQEPLTVEYAADIPSSKYFTKRELFDMINEPKTDPLDNFDLLRVNVLKNSLLQFTKMTDQNQISGITIPWFYFGMVYSTFCWHTEDLYLYSLNYMHEGSSKIWYSVSHTQKEKLDELIRQKYYATLIKQPNLVHTLTVHINPLEIIQHGIKVYRVVQNPGEIIITLPKGYHSGFSTGFNIAEAVNFSTLKWVDYGFQSIIDYKKHNSKLPVFPIDWVIMQNYENVKNTNFSNKNYKNKLKSYVNSIISGEIENRINLEAFFKLNKINYIIEEIDKNDTEENFECDMCTFYGFLSQLQCNNCKKKGCLNHSIQCKCLPTDFSMRIRYLTKDLLEIKSKKKLV